MLGEGVGGGWFLPASIGINVARLTQIAYILLIKSGDDKAQNIAEDNYRVGIN